MEDMRLKKKVLGIAAGLQGAEFRSLGHLECIRPGKKEQYLCHPNA